VIVGFGDKGTEDLYNGVASARARRIDVNIRQRALDRLTALNVATRLDDLRVPPSNRLEVLQGDLAGFWSIRVNDQWRIIFKWNDGQASEVRLTDYH
jgi:proteic killer suppression protein